VAASECPLTVCYVSQTAERCESIKLPKLRGGLTVLGLPKASCSRQQVLADVSEASHATSKIALEVIDDTRAKTLQKVI
jgi:hypothetical protein